MAFTWNGPKIAAEVSRQAGKGLRAATLFLTRRVKDALSVPAPRVRFTNRRGETYYRAGWGASSAGKVFINTMARSYEKDPATGALRPVRIPFKPSPATQGEPPRKLSGRLRDSVTYEFLDFVLAPGGAVEPKTGRVGTNVPYARPLEEHKNQHAFLSRTVRDLENDIAAVLYRGAK